MKKLHLGSGSHALPGWDNLDMKASSGIIRCDLTKPLPYPDSSVSYIFSEHFIEHLDEVDGFNLLKQCYRVMVPGGRVRIACPDLRQYVEAYLNWNPTPQEKKNFSSGANYLNYAMLGEAKKGINYLSGIRQSTDHGHLYYYDEPELAAKLQRAGFINPIRCEYHQSKTIELQRLERRAPTRDMIVEATKDGMMI